MSTWIFCCLRMLVEANMSVYNVASPLIKLCRGFCLPLLTCQLKRREDSEIQPVTASRNTNIIKDAGLWFFHNRGYSGERMHPSSSHIGAQQHNNALAHWLPTTGYVKTDKIKNIFLFCPISLYTI